MAETATKKEFKLHAKGSMSGFVVVQPKVPTSRLGGVVKIDKDGKVAVAWNDKSIPKHWVLYPENYTVAVESSSTSIGDGYVEVVGGVEQKLATGDINKVSRKGDVVTFVTEDKSGTRNAVASLVNAAIREEGDGNEYKAFKKIPVKAASGGTAKKTTAKKSTKKAATTKKKTTAKKTTAKKTPAKSTAKKTATKKTATKKSTKAATKKKEPAKKKTAAKSKKKVKKSK